MSTFKIKPASADVIVRDPETRRPLAAKGEEKPRNPYWLRRVKDGDVEIVEPKAAKAASTNTGGDA